MCPIPLLCSLQDSLSVISHAPASGPLHRHFLCLEPSFTKRLLGPLSPLLDLYLNVTFLVRSSQTAPFNIAPPPHPGAPTPLLLWFSPQHTLPSYIMFVPPAYLFFSHHPLHPQQTQRHTVECKLYVGFVFILFPAIASISGNSSIKPCYMNECRSTHTYGV